MAIIKKEKTFFLRGRKFTKADILIMKSIIVEHYDKGRSFISQEICKRFDWKQENGWLKDRACREVLRELHKKRVIPLPRSRKKRKKLTQKTASKKDILERKLIDPINDLNFNNVVIKSVKGTKEERLWNRLMNDYHYLGFRTFVGRSLKYLFYVDNKIIGGIGFCDPAWQLAARDELCLSKGLLEHQIRSCGINNGRFLILQWVAVPNLASYILSKSVKLARKEWEKYYSVYPYYIETFVDPEKFHGTCYLADNWKLVGKTKGYKKSGSVYSNSQVPKLIFLKFFRPNSKRHLKAKYNNYGLLN